MLETSDRSKIGLPKEKTYSKEEVELLLNKCWLQCQRKMLEPMTEKGFKTFIKDNL